MTTNLDHSYAIVPADGADLPTPVRAIWVGTAGDIKVEFFKDTPGGTVLKNVPIGKLEGHIKKVWATGTAATNLVGLY